MNIDLNNMVAVVTGGAGTLGSQISRKLARAGARVVVASRNLSKCQKLVDELHSESLTAMALEMDVSDEVSVAEAVDKILAQWGTVNILVNNAGVSTATRVEDMTVAEWNEVMSVNCTGVFICSKVFSKPMISSGGGVIINVGSIYGSVSPNFSLYNDDRRLSPMVYGAGKAAVVQMTRYMAVYWAEKNIRVNCISPGGVYNGHESEFVESYGRLTPMSRMANREEIDGLVIFLASDAAGYITGQNILVDGGWTAW